MKARQIAYMFNLTKEYDDAVKELGESHTYCQGCAEGNVLQHEENHDDMLLILMKKTFDKRGCT